MIEQINEISQMWWGWMWPMFWQVGLLVALVAVVDFLIRKWAWPQLRYALWLLVLVKLILPPTLTSPSSLTSKIPLLAEKAVKVELIKSERPAQIAETTTPAEPVYAIPDLHLPVDTETAIAPALGEEAIVSVQPEVADVLAVLSWKAYAFIFWLGGIVVLTTWLTIRLKNLRRGHLDKKFQQVLPERLKELLAVSANKLGLKRVPEVILTSRVCSPAIFGIFRPTLLMPAERLSTLTRKDAEHIFLHELAHIKRGDLIVHAVYMSLQIVYWFNPLLWLLRKRLHNLRELCCDATVARILKEKTSNYRETLLETAKQLLAEPVDLGLGLLGLFENSNSLTDRLKWLEKKTWKHRGLRIVIIFAVVALMSACVLPMAKASKKREDATEDNKQKELQYIAALPRGVSGVSVELVGVCEYPSKRCWRPDGSAIDEQIFATKGNVPPRKGDYGFMVKLDGPRDLNFKWRKIEGAAGWSGSCKVSDGQGNILDGFEAVISDMKEGQLSTTLRIGIAAGPWETIASHDGKRMNSGSRTGVLWSQAFESRDGTHIVASNEWCKDRAERIVAIDKEGVLHATHHGSVASGKVNQLTATFRNLKLSRIREFRFQTRPYEWIEFKNVSLHPGHKTDVKIATVDSEETFDQPSLEAQNRRWGPEQATGEPDTHGAGDIPTAWASRTPDGQTEWLLLEYEKPVVPVRIDIHETHNPGAVNRIGVYTMDGKEVMVWRGIDPISTESKRGVSQIPIVVDFKTKRLKIYLDSPSVPGWNEVDAVGLVDASGQTQWAIRAEASSTFAERSVMSRARRVRSRRTRDSATAKGRNWGPEQATGQPDTPEAGDIPTAWASLTPDGQEEWLLLEYTEPVVPVGFKIYETYNPGAVHKVSVFTPDGKEVEVWAGKDPTPPGSSKGVSEISLATDITTKRLKIYLDSPSVPGWNEIDAVELIDEHGRSQWAISAEASSTYAERGEGRRTTRAADTPENVKAASNREPIPPNAVQIGYVDDTAEGKRSLGASGHAVIFECPETPRYIEAVQICVSRYGTSTPPSEDFHLYVLNEKQQVLADLNYPYAMIERNGLQWYTLSTPSIEVPKRFYIALSFNPHRTKGIYLGLDKNVEQSHSLVGLPDSGFEGVKEPYDWMVRVFLSEQPSGKRGVKRLVDFKPPQVENPFKGCVEIRYDRGESDGKQSYGSGGPAIRIMGSDLFAKIDSPLENLELKGFRLYASRYGSGYDPEKTILRIIGLNSGGQELWQYTFPYASFSYKAKWVNLVLPEPIAAKDLVSTGEPLIVAFDPQAHKYKGIYFHYNANPKTSHSLKVNRERMFQGLPGREWMIRACFESKPVRQEGKTEMPAKVGKPKVVSVNPQSGL